MSPEHDDAASVETSIRPAVVEQETEIVPASQAEQSRGSLAQKSVAEDSLGGWLPSRPASMASGPAPPADPLDVEPGGRIGEFVVERTLGKGAFGVVYLARQLSLDRYVALKVVAPQPGYAAEGEGRSLARLEHDHIVQVYAETTEPATGARLLCMQYVAGTTLATLIRELRKFGPGGWTGADLLGVLDRLDLPPALFDPAAMEDRAELADADHVRAVCRIGEQLARALAHAHDRAVLHRDIKPANVLVSRYGRPLLADFNLATRDSAGSDVFGGTLAYMAPEHLDAFNPDSPTTYDAADARSDLYSLAVVLWELASGKLPYPHKTVVEGSSLAEELRELAHLRRESPPEHPPCDRRLRQALLRGLRPDPKDRYPTAADFAATLAGLAEQRAAVKCFPHADPVARWSWRHPVTALMLAGLLPQIAGSALQISYNTIRIVGALTPAQKELFPTVVLVYNLVAYPACLAWLAVRVVRVLRVWRALRRGEPLDDAQVDLARRRSLELPRQAAVAACFGWLPGMLVFPAWLHYGAEPVAPEEWVHFIASFLLGGLIAITYTYFWGTGVVVRTMYVRFWTDPRGFRDRAVRELAHVPDRLPWVNILAGSIPLAGAALLVWVAPRDSGSGDYLLFQILMTALLLAGMAGYTVVDRLTRRYLQVVEACTGVAAKLMRRGVSKSEAA